MYMYVRRVGDAVVYLRVRARKDAVFRVLNKETWQDNRSAAGGHSLVVVDKGNIYVIDAAPAYQWNLSSHHLYLRVYVVVSKHLSDALCYNIYRYTHPRMLYGLVLAEGLLDT